VSVGVLYQADILLDGVAASTDMNRVKGGLNQEVKAVTAFGDVARHFLAGVYTGNVDGDFYYQTGNNMIPNLLEQEYLPADLISFSPNVVSIAPDLAIGSMVYMLQGALAKSEYTGQYGEVLKGSFSYVGGITGRAVQGQRLLRASQSGTSGTGTAVNIGAVAAGQSLYATLNVIGTTGTGSGNVLSIISSATSSLTAPTTRITFVSGSSSRVGEWASVAGPITDTWWAAKWVTFGGTSFTVGISAGIQ
jgi:hypothetical protein